MTNYKPYKPSVRANILDIAVRSVYPSKAEREAIESGAVRIADHVSGLGKSGSEILVKKVGVWLAGLNYKDFEQIVKWSRSGYR